MSNICIEKVNPQNIKSVILRKTLMVVLKVKQNIFSKASYSSITIEKKTFETY